MGSEVDPPAAGDETARRRLFEAITRLVQAVSDTAQRQGRALIFFLDDLHWCDRATLDLLRYLVYRLHGSHVWLLGTYRAEDLAAEHPLRALRHTLGREARLALLQLGPLKDAAIMQMAAALVRISERQAQPLAAYLGRQSGGNPFILSQLVEAFAAHGLLRPIGDGWAIAGDWTAELTPSQDRRLEVPFSVCEMVLERMERLQPTARRLLQIAAVAMPRLEAELLDILAEDRHLAADSLASCLESRLLVCPQLNTYDFPLDLIRQVVYNSMLPSLRQQLEQTLVRAYERLERAKQQLGRSGYRRHVLVGGDNSAS
jgi:predicted ATPase